MTYAEMDKSLMPLLEKQQKIREKTGLFSGLIVWVPSPNILSHRDVYSSREAEVEEWADSMCKIYAEVPFSVYIDGKLYAGNM